MHCNLKLFDCLLRLPHSATGSLCCSAGSEKASWTGSAVSFTVKLNTEDLHKNRETPSAFICQLGVVDSRLPLNLTAQKGAWNTRPRSCGEQVFYLCIYQGFTFHIVDIIAQFYERCPCWTGCWSLSPSSFPPALNQHDFVEPHGPARDFRMVGGCDGPKGDPEGPFQWGPCFCQCLQLIVGWLKCIFFLPFKISAKALSRLCMGLLLCIQLHRMDVATFRYVAGGFVVGGRSVEVSHKCAKEIIKGHLG